MKIIPVKEYILRNARIRVLSAERNEEAMQKCPHRMICDLVEMVYVNIDEIVENGLAGVTYDAIEHFEITEEELFEAAEKNTEANGFTMFGLDSFMRGQSALKATTHRPMSCRTMSYFMW